ncbi:MAG: hypothetical protein RBG13Loki_0958 [Promethearchaeota archaeon CR_4]|nr:MAG: hypothetical protein RBG13Loki_0958 [Candidatus Lokiarchaeota archaeon CR_4]
MIFGSNPRQHLVGMLCDLVVFSLHKENLITISTFVSSINEAMTACPCLDSPPTEGLGILLIADTFMNVH